MNKKNFILIGLVLLMAVAYAVFFTDWFKPQIMTISHTTRAMPGRGNESNPITFGLGDYYELTEIKVVAIDDLANKDVQPLWHLVSEGSDSVNRFSYGENIGGMDPAVEGVKAQPLKPGVRYRLYVTAGKARGQHDFQIGPSR